MIVAMRKVFGNMSGNVEQKICGQCKQMKPLTDFSRNKTKRGGYQGQCKQCIREYKIANRVAIATRQRAWRAENVEHIAEYEKRYKQENKDHQLEAMRQYRERNRELLREKQRKYNKEHAQHYRLWQQTPRGKDSERARAHNRRAKKLAVGGKFTKEDVLLAYHAQRGKCWHCGKHVGLKYHADHLIPLDKGGSNDARNIVIACAWCNQSKGAKFCWQWNGRLF